MGDQHDTQNRISRSTIHGNVFMGGIITLVTGPRQRLLVAVVCVLALLGGGTTYWALHASETGSDPVLSARYDPEHGGVGATAVVPRVVKPADLPTVADCGAVRTWSHAQGGTDVGASPLTVSMVGNGHTVAIEQVRVAIVGEPRDPVPGTVVNCNEQGVGKKIDMGVDLDSSNPIALIGAAGPVSFAPYFTDKYLYLENQKPELVSLTVLAARHSYNYVVMVEGSVDGKRHTWTLKDGDRPFHISGVRMERGTELSTQGNGWETTYGRGAGERIRCNPCVDQDEQRIPGTAVAVAPAGYSFTSTPGADPTAPLAPPKERPAAVTPPLTVDEHDAESIAIAWAVTSGSFDASRGDTGPAAVLGRVRRYLTPELAAARRVERVLGARLGLARRADRPPGLVGGHARDRETRRGPRGSERPHRCQGRAGGSRQLRLRRGGRLVPDTQRGLTARLQLQRGPDGRYLISDIGEVKYDFPALTDQP
ncbi:hypothetical protein ACFQ0T_04065 [Kitasatospora gansuensis]